jgi:acyl-CoA synthetase (AMP-forming)/AMP-acid ligase II
LSGSVLPELSGRLRQVLSLDSAARAVEFGQAWTSWGELAASADLLAREVVAGQRVAVLLRNRPQHVALLVGLLCSGACVVTVNPARGADRVTADLAGLGVDTVAGEPGDLAAFVPVTGTLRRLTSPRPGVLEVAGEAPGGTPAGTSAGVAVEMLTSGTTGPPKRVPLSYQTLSRVLSGAKHYEADRGARLRLRDGVAVVNAPLVHLGGLFRVLQCVNDGRSFCLLERFEVQPWLDAVRRHRPATVSLVPAALRMVLEADVDRADLASVRSVISGTAPLSPDDADAFFDRYGVPVLISYAATEFGGGVAGWNLADFHEHWKDKRGSVGRAHAGCELRVVDPESGQPLGCDVEGVLQVKAGQLGDDLAWLQTTDLARIDADGFVWIVGRADQAIIRGGFKVLPDEVRVALERDSRVRAAAVVGLPDARLGSVPVAAVELRTVADPPSADELLTSLSRVLARYELPTQLRIVEQLPRTPSGKVDLAAVRELMGAAAP